MSRYIQLAREEKYQIYASLKAGHNQNRIAAILGRHKSTICRELCRNRGLMGCRPKQADRLANNRHYCEAVRRITTEDWSESSNS